MKKILEHQIQFDKYINPILPMINMYSIRYIELAVLTYCEMNRVKNCEIY